MKHCIFLGFIVVALALAGGCNYDPLDTGGLEGEGKKGMAVTGEYDQAEVSFKTDTFVTIGVEGQNQLPIATPGDNAQPVEMVSSDFSAYIGAEFESGNTVSGTMNQSSATIAFEGGWAYLVGGCPIGKTKGVKAVGSGTRMVMENGPGDMVRVYLVPSGYHNHTIAIYADAGGAEPHVATLDQEGKYIEVTGGVAGPPTDLSGAQLLFIERVRDAVTAVNMEWPPDFLLDAPYP